MNRDAQESEGTKKTVLFADLCSSTSIIEELIRSENQQRWRRVLENLDRFLIAWSAVDEFELYKFIGDGWVLLFEPAFSDVKLLSLMHALCKRYQKVFDRVVKPVLSTDVGNVGITFGLDRGALIPVEMNSRKEYIGRPLNVAARLQAAIKDKDKEPQGKVLMSNSAYEKMRASIVGKYKVWPRVTRNLRNISGGEHYQAKKVRVFPEVEQES